MDPLPQTSPPNCSPVIAKCAQEPSKDHEQPNDARALTCSAGQGALTGHVLFWRQFSNSESAMPDTHVRDVFRQAGWRHILHLEQREVKFRIILPLQEHSLSSSAPAERELSPDHWAFPYSKHVSCDRALFWPLLLPEINVVSNSYSEGKHYCWEQYELLRLTDFKVKKALGQLHVTCE